MADETQAGEGAKEAGQGSQQVTLNVLAQYIKDMSFESPNAPKTLQPGKTQPRLEVSVNVQASGVGEDLYEVVLSLEAHAKTDDDVVYNIELLYGGMFRVKGASQEMLQPILFIDCPALLFPFARRVMADVSRDGGFPPLLLDPIDFRTLYRRNLENAQKEAGSGPKN
ncbi:Protein-export protein SecB [Methyloligella halotolerans]|uniref:Protein-export protein SecB n=1 Tax=Methyloligella halotolerans TaxID=1177755 RepID=A0A1E2S122_9HYPH|nr:protein-export chaperone SecB [Methyloligella halotolerans]ODA68038.1 Protein-export protein SecB [Methyloligella halotolerans]